MSSWTLEQAAELVLEEIVRLLDGCDDDDTVRPAIVVEAVREVWAPRVQMEPVEYTAGELRARVAAARRRLADGELSTIPTMLDQIEGGR